MRAHDICCILKHYASANPIVTETIFKIIIGAVFVVILWAASVETVGKSHATFTITANTYIDTYVQCMELSI